MIVADIMTTFPEALSPDDTIQKAAKLMRDHDYGVIPILDTNDSLVGIVTDRDIVVKAIADGHGPETALSVCMTDAPDSVPKDLPIAQALHLMEKHQIRRLPVVEYGRLIGMVSLSDISASGVSEQGKVDVLESVSAKGGALRSGVAPPEA